ncbi:uroporphyrinogen decarboxylase-like [Amphiura filiformis]|uniref:uroporphyrinogen decarboxylase-like n=1 Tax=Amphiura filiformis TaxID=82378 RepID=UPI003B227C56
MSASTEIQAFPPLRNDLILRAARREKVERVPVWMMRQAGRILPEFRAIREKYDFFTLCQTPELACEVTLMPLNHFDVDAAILFSDILVIPQAMGLKVEMIPGKGPSFPEPIQTPKDLERLKEHVDVNESLNYVFQAITKTRHALQGSVPLIGFSGAPWTLMAYSIEGGGSTTFSKSKAWLYVHSEDAHRFLQLITDVIVDYLVGQVIAGAQLLQLFESHAGILGHEMFCKFSMPYLQQIATKVKQKLTEKSVEPVPMIVFAKGAHYAIQELATLGYDVVSIDWTVEPELAKMHVREAITLQGNLDPCALYSSNEDLITYTKNMVKHFGTQQYIANLGHGVYPDMDPEKCKLFVDTVHKYSSELNKDEIED